jgi:hypothetical protein
VIGLAVAVRILPHDDGDHSTACARRTAYRWRGRRRDLAFELSSIQQRDPSPARQVAEASAGRPGVGRRCVRGVDRELWALPQLVAAACQVGGLGGVACQFDGFVVGRA